MMPAATPMGPPIVGSRLDRLVEVQKVLRELRHALTYREIAEQTGINLHSLSDFGLGKRAPSAEQLAKLRNLQQGDPS
jgi:hypothetical protein